VKANPPSPGGYPEGLIKDIVSSFQEAVIEVLVRKTLQAAGQQMVKRVVLSGGVAANHRLRERMRDEASREGVKVYIPSPSFCTDNAAMIAVAGYAYLKRGVRSPYSLNAFSNLPL
jgi:N6-L-threonylcarbamoyladenine synthase